MPRVLVIDDDEQFLSMMQLMLDRGGYDVLIASNGKQGIGVCESTPVDLVITDIVMPDMEGLEVIMELRRRFSGMKIIATSGGGRNDPGNYLNLAAALGANNTLTKPFFQSELLEAVKSLVG